MICSLSAGPLDHLRPIDERKGGFEVEGIDFIYLINLDQRPERWDNCLKQLFPYGIFPQRFPGIYGWSLPIDVIQDIGLKFAQGMSPGPESVATFSQESQPQLVFPQYGQTIFSNVATKGAIGCTLSHLSVLKDAYEAGYETIWILEDDIVVLDNPHLLSERIRELDALIDDWDLLYTDFDRLVLDPNRSVASQFAMMWRPDMPFLNTEFLRHYTEVNQRFAKIGNRIRTHSIIYRRSGIEKVLEFYREYNMFLPYDNELSLIPDIQLYVLRQNIVSSKEVTSDTRHKNFH